MAGPNQITIDSDVNDISIDITENIVQVVDENCPTEISITQPVTRVVQLAAPGPIEPRGPRGIDGRSTNFLATGSVTASVDVTGKIFKVTSAQAYLFVEN